jgi:hypothetical protein
LRAGNAGRLKTEEENDEDSTSLSCASGGKHDREHGARPGARLGLGNGVTLASTNFDAHYLFTARRFRPYAGGGLGINFIDVTSGIGRGGGLNIEPVLNVVAG